MNLFCILLGIALIVVSYLFWIGKGVKYIRAWEETPIEEKNKVNIGKVGRNIACIFALGSVIFIITGFSPTFKEKAFVWSMIGYLILIGADVYHMGKFKCYKINSKNA